MPLEISIRHDLTNVNSPLKSASQKMDAALLFDMDGVLVDVSGSYRRAIEETVHLFTGAVVPPGAVQAYKNQGGFNDDWKLTAQIIADAGVDVSYGAIVEAFQLKYQGRNWDGFIADEPALLRTDVLTTLAETYPLALVTGRPEAEARFTLERFGWDAYFPVVIAMEQQAGRGKPDPYPLELALSQLGLSPERATYIGDTGDDMVAAKQAGCQAIGIVPPYLPAPHAEVLRQAGADTVLTDVNALDRLRMKDTG